MALHVHYHGKVATTRERRRGDHLNGDDIELYALGRLDEETCEQVEAHLTCCKSCRANVGLEVAIIDSIREALVAEVWDEIHRTQSGGAVKLAVLATGRGFTGRIVGGEIDAGRTCSTFDDAQQWCQRAFSEMFPEHRCGLDCTSR